MEIKPSISFVLPMYNESDNIESTISVLSNIASSIAGEYEIIVVDDGSTDASVRIVEDIAVNDTRVKLFRMGRNTRFGGAFARGFKSASKDVIMYMDSDMPVETEDIETALPLISEAWIVTGYSTVKKGENARRKLMSGVYNFLVESLFGLNVKDINSGFKIVRRDLVRDLDFVSKSPFVDVELFIHARKKGYKVIQYPLIFRDRTGGRSYISRLPVVAATFLDMLKVKLRALR